MSINSFIKNVKEDLIFKSFNSDVVSTMEQQKQSNRLIRFVLVSATVSLIAVEPSIVIAGAGGGGVTAGSLETMVNNILSTLTGTFGKGIATIAIMVMGIMAMFGKLAWDTAIKVIVGIAVTFGAATIVTWLTGGTSFSSIS